MDDEKKNAIEKFKLEGFNLELATLPNVAVQLARFDISSPSFEKDSELKDLTILSRKYLKCAFNKAIERYGEKIKGDNDNGNS